MPCELVPFGIDKSLELSIPRHHYNCAYREFKPTLKERIQHCFEQKKGWIKLNAAYLVCTTFATAAAYTSSYLAEKMGISRESATTWISGVSAFVVGITANCTAWYFLNKEKYKDNGRKLTQDTLAFIKNISKAQLITWVGTWTVTYLLVTLGAGNALAVTLQQVIDRMIYLPLYNYFNRKLANE